MTTPSIQPLVTAVMPVFNAESTLKEAIGSIVDQTLESWELIVVDDGSTDRSADIAAGFQDPRIQLVRFDRNRGRAVARNAALALARGLYVAVCDGDDISLPTRFERQVEFLQEHPDIGVVASQILHFTSDQPPQLRISYPEASSDIERRFNDGRMAIPHASAMLRRHLLVENAGYDADFRRCQDLDLFLRLRDRTQFATLSAPLVKYRQSTQLRFRYWFENSLFHRYAYYRAWARKEGAVALTFDAFINRLDVRFKLWTIDVIRYLAFRMRLRGSGAVRLGNSS